MRTIRTRDPLFSNSAFYLAANIARSAVPFAMLPILTRYLNPTEYGQVAMFQLLVSALSAVTGVSVHGAANRRYYDAGVSKRELALYLGSCLQILLISTLITFTAVLLMQRQLSDWLGLRSEWVYWAAVVSSATFAINLRLGQWQIRGAALQYGILQVAQSIATVVLAIVLVVGLNRGGAGRIEAQIWVTPLFAIISLGLLLRSGLLRFNWRPDQLKDALAFGAPLIPHVAGLFLLSAADRFVIKTISGLRDAGIYMVALQLTTVMSVVYDAINKAYVPWLYDRLAHGSLEDKRKIVRWTYYHFAISIFASGAAFLVGPKIVSILAGRAYQGAGELVGWLALGQAFSGMYLMVTNYVFFSKRTGMLSLSTITSGCLNVLLLFVLVRRYGLIGAAWAFAAAMAFRFALTWWIAHRRHPMPWFAPIPF